MPRSIVWAAVPLLLLAACEKSPAPTADAPEPAPSVAAAAPVIQASPPAVATTPAAAAKPAAHERFIALGTEPFWNARVAAGQVVYSTPENQAGETIAVVPSAAGPQRIFTGSLNGKPFVLRLRAEKCSDGMSDRSYRYAADLKVADEDRKGCAEPGTALKPE